MGKIFGIKKKEREQKNDNIGYISPSNNRFINSQNNNGEIETFVYHQNNNMNNNREVEVLGENLSPYGVKVNNVASVPEVLEMTDDVNTIDTSKLDPLNNSNNPIPVNPTSDIEKVEAPELIDYNVKANVFSVIGMMLGMILTPGTTIINNVKKYRSLNKTIFITIWITIVTLVLCLVTRILLGSFFRTYNGVTGEYTLNFNISNVFSFNNYFEYLVIAFLISFVAILVVSLIYYASSFVNSKGVPFSSYLMVSNLAMLPLIIGVVILYPVGNLFSGYISLLFLIFTFLYSLVSFFVGMGEIISFKSINRKILYNVLNLTFIILIMFFIVVMLIRFNVLIMPDIVV